MRHQTLHKILEYTSSEAQVEATVNYLAEKLQPIVKTDENVLIVFPNKDPSGLGAIMGRAVSRCNAVPLFLNGDLRWKNLLLTAFSSKASTIIAPRMLFLA